MDSMTQQLQSTEQFNADLLVKYKTLREEEPRVFARDAAKRLGVSEGELLAARCGDGVVRLDNRWEDLINAMPGVGKVMCLTRNDWVVHERKGVFDNVRVSETGGIVLNPDIDLRLNFAHWGFAFAVTDSSPHGERKSLQIFDPSGVAVHKIHKLDETDADAWEALVSGHTAEDQSVGQSVVAPEPPVPDAPDETINVEAIRDKWRSMRDVHQFMGILRRFKVGRVQAFRLAGPEFAERIDNDGFRRALEGAAEQKLPVMIFVNNPGMIQIHTGPVENLKQVGEWFNVLDPDFNLHLLAEGIDSTWVVKKASKDGFITSLETFDKDGNQIAWMFGKRTEGQEELKQWQALAESLAKPAQAAS